jgi:serine/threonine protein kinase
MQAGARKRTPERSPAGTHTPSSEHDGLIAGAVVDGRFRLAAALDVRGNVWRATDAAGGSCVLKAGNRDAIECEYRVLNRLRHPNIVRADEYIVGDTRSFLVLEDLPGGNLVSLAGSKPAAWLDAIGCLGDTLAWIHERGIVHRDVKARNVLFVDGQILRLADFGSALPVGSAWRTGGTTVVLPGRDDSPVSFADDVHAFACLIHEMLYGVPPRSGERKAVPASCAALARLVDIAIGQSDPDAIPALDVWRTVIESVSADFRGKE